MSDPTDPTPTPNPTPTPEPTPTPTPSVDELVAEKLKDIKGRLDTVYSERDGLKKQLQEATDKLAKAERDRLVAEGKELEALKLQTTDLAEQNKVLQAQLVAATRDSQLNAMLASLPFRTDKARAQALREITADLTQTSDGAWVTKAGVPLDAFVKSYSEDAENTYLFKPKTSSGGGSTSTNPATPTNGKKSLFEMSQTEVLKLAKEGKLRR